MTEFMLFDSEQQAQAELDKLGLRAIVAKLDFAYGDGSTATKYAINRIIMGEARDGSDMSVEWLRDDGSWR